MLGPAFLWKDLFKLMFIFESPVQATLCLGGPPSAPGPRLTPFRLEPFHRLDWRPLRAGLALGRL